MIHKLNLSEDATNYEGPGNSTRLGAGSGPRGTVSGFATGTGFMSRLFGLAPKSPTAASASHGSDGDLGKK